MKLIRIEKGIYNIAARRSNMVPYIHIQSSGQIRFSSLFVNEFNIQGGETFDFFTDESGGKYFFKLHTEGLFTIQKHHRIRKSGEKTKENDEYISQSVALRYVIERKHPAIKGKSIKLISVGFDEEAEAHKLDILPVFKNSKRNVKK